ncbi:hypothetical protein FQA39_LY13039 [Lamprigera yunnana]|nr:hypothetical protein FQA39_LY13039 [Lamprigera yunnana]
MVDMKKDNFIGTVKAGIPNFVLYFAIFINAYISTSLVVNLPSMIEGINDNGTSMEQKLLSAMGPWSNFIVSAVIGLNQDKINFEAEEGKITNVILPNPEEMVYFSVCSLGKEKNASGRSLIDGLDIIDNKFVKSKIEVVQFDTIIERLIPAK